MTYKRAHYVTNDVSGWLDWDLQEHFCLYIYNLIQNVMRSEDIFKRSLNPFWPPNYLTNGLNNDIMGFRSTSGTILLL